MIRQHSRFYWLLIFSCFIKSLFSEKKMNNCIADVKKSRTVHIMKYEKNEMDCGYIVKYSAADSFLCEIYSAL